MFLFFSLSLSLSLSFLKILDPNLRFLVSFVLVLGTSPFYPLVLVLGASSVNYYSCITHLLHLLRHDNDFRFVFWVSVVIPAWPMWWRTVNDSFVWRSSLIICSVTGACPMWVTMKNGVYAPCMCMFVCVYRCNSDLTTSWGVSGFSLSFLPPPDSSLLSVEKP